MEKKEGWFSWARLKKTDPTLVAVSLGHGITHWYPSTLYIILPYLAKDLGLTYSQVGVLMGWNHFTSFFINLPGGLIVDMVGKTGFLLGLALALIGLPYSFLGFSSSYVVALLVITFVGIGNNLWHPAALSLLANRYPERKGFAIALHSMGGNLGNTLAPFAVGVVLTFVIWRHVLILNLIPGVLMGFVLWRLLAKGGPVRDQAKGKELSLKEYWEAVKTLAKNKSILLLCCLSGMRAMTQSGLFTFLPIYLANVLKYSPALVGSYISVVQAAGIFSSPIAGTISDKKGRRPVLTAGLLTTSLLLVALVILRLNFLFIGVLAFLGFFLFSLHPVMFAWMMDLAPKNISGTTVSTQFGIQALFSGFAPAICGFIADRFGILYSFYFLAATIFTANFLVYMIPDKPVEEGVPQAQQA
ncbi:MAG: MFS transporter [Candidatus Tectomicrobia bacterium]|uniref:MFS transporter n=1 Tax=Tectimicrobiota bacterium TaxID=2528274 RepID=A0A932GQR2_UNCTE|nr:MFS transporter [Candidatus Tectomicrobia bacterium]